MKHSLIGSKLFSKLFPDNIKIQKRCEGNKDTDVLVYYPLDIKDASLKQYFKNLYGNKTEVHHIEPIIELIDNKNVDILTYRNILFTLKASHIPWDTIHKEKTFYDLFLMSEEGCKIIPELYYELNQYWTNKFGEKWRADFTKESEDFFDDYVSRENVHDELHEKVKKFEQPAFKYLQEPGQTTVYVDEKKFYETTEEIRRAVVIEEAQVLALERFLLPKIKENEFLSYLHFIKVLVERCAPLWMTIYIINNLNYFLTYKNKFYDPEV